MMVCGVVLLGGTADVILSLTVNIFFLVFKGINFSPNTRNSVETQFLCFRFTDHHVDSMELVRYW